MNIRILVKTAAMAALYVVLTVVIAPFGYGPIQFRISEVLVLLCFFRKDYIYSLIVGCFVANLFNPMQEMLVFDLVFGTLHTAISVFIISKMKNIYLASLVPTLFMFIIGLELYFVLGLPFWITTITLMLSEFIVVSLIAVPIFLLIRKNPDMLEMMEANQNIGGTNEF
jgi:uncharacterized membrane protein